MHEHGATGHTTQCMGMAAMQLGQTTATIKLHVLVCAGCTEPYTCTILAARSTRTDRLMYRFASHGGRTHYVDSVCVCASKTATLSRQQHPCISCQAPAKLVNASFCEASKRRKHRAARPRGRYRKRCRRRQHLCRPAAGTCVEGALRRPAKLLTRDMSRRGYATNTWAANRGSVQRLSRARRAEWPTMRRQHKLSGSLLPDGHPDTRASSRKPPCLSSMKQSGEEAEAICKTPLTRSVQEQVRQAAFPALCLRGRRYARKRCQYTKPSAVRKRGHESTSPTQGAKRTHARPDRCRERRRAGGEARLQAPLMKPSADCKYFRYQGGGAAVPSRVLDWHEMPPTMQGAFLSVGVEATAFQHLCERDWCREWYGWERVKQDMEDSEVLEWMEHFLRLSAQDTTSVVGQVSNAQRLAALAEDNLYLYRASSDGCNCLIDSLTMALAAADLVPRTLLDCPSARVAGCRSCRAHLVRSTDPTLRPRWRGPSGDVLNLREHEHANAYLQPEIHGQAVLTHLLEYYKNTAARRIYDFIILAYTRFDGPVINPYEGAIVVPASEGAPGQRSPIQLHLFNHMDARGNGYHFDALVPGIEPATGSSGSPRVSAVTSSGLSGLIASRITRNAEALQEMARKRAKTQQQQAPATSRSSRCNKGRLLDLERLRQVLQEFFRARGSDLRITAQDAKEIEAIGQNNRQLGQVLLTKLQATLYNSDSQPHAAEKLAAAWRRYLFVQSQGPARRLGTAEEGRREESQTAREQATPSSQSSGPPSTRLTKHGIKRNSEGDEASQCRCTNIEELQRHPSIQRCSPNTQAAENLREISTAQCGTCRGRSRCQQTHKQTYLRESTCPGIHGRATSPRSQAPTLQLQITATPRRLPAGSRCRTGRAGRGPIRSSRESRGQHARPTRGSGRRYGRRSQALPEICDVTCQGAALRNHGSSLPAARYALWFRCMHLDGRQRYRASRARALDACRRVAGASRMSRNLARTDEAL